MKPQTSFQQHLFLSTRQAGYSLVELGVAVAIVAMLVLVALAGVQNILTSARIDQQVQNVARLTSKINSLYANGTAGVTQLEVVQVGGWTNQYANTTTGAVTSAWGTAEGIAPNANAAGSMAAQAGFVYIIYGVPKEACVDLAKSLSNLVYSIAPWSPAGGDTAGYANTPSTTFSSANRTKPAGSAFSTSRAAVECNQSATLDMVMTIKP